MIASLHGAVRISKGGWSKGRPVPLIGTPFMWRQTDLGRIFLSDISTTKTGDGTASEIFGDRQQQKTLRDYRSACLAATEHMNVVPLRPFCTRNSCSLGTFGVT